MVKIDTPGVAYCFFCNDKVHYGGSGKKDLTNHFATNKHISAARAQLCQPTMSGTGPKTQDEVIRSKTTTKEPNVFSIFKKVQKPTANIVASGSPVVPPITPLQPKPIVPYNESGKLRSNGFRIYCGTLSPSKSCCATDNIDSRSSQGPASSQ